MDSYKVALSELAQSRKRPLSDEETKRLKDVLIKAYCDIAVVCNKYNLKLMLGGGSCLGAIRHNGFIPWDDDLDVNMPRKDYEIFKKVFEKELGESYILNAPNYSEKPISRFPKIMIKGTKYIEEGMSTDDTSLINIDLFVMENVPSSKIYRLFKGGMATLVMAIAGSVEFMDWYKKDKSNPIFETKGMIEARKKRQILGTIFSFRSKYYWYNKVDLACQYDKETDLVGFPTGRKHYFGEIHKRMEILPLSEAVFEGISVKVPGDVKSYLTGLYGNKYMEVPPVEKRETHFVVDISFDNI